MTKNITITAEEAKKRNSAKHLYSLDELAKKIALEQQEVIVKNKHSASTKVRKTRSTYKRCLLWLACLLLVPIVLIMGALVYITSPLAEHRLTSWVVSGINHMGKSSDLRVHIGLLRGFWDGELKLYDVRIQDKFGPWLYVEEGTIHPDWGGVVRLVVAVLQYQRTGSVSSYLHGNAKAISEIRNNRNTYNKDENSVYTPQDGDELDNNIDILSDNTSPTPPEKINAKSFEVAAMQKKSVPVVMVPHTPDVMDNLLEPSNVLKDKVTIGIKVGTLLGVRMPRFPRYNIDTEETPTQSKAISFMPPWCALDVGEFEVANFQLGPSGRDVFISARFQGQISSNQARLRSTFLAEKTSSGQWVLPYTQDLPADVTLSMRQLHEKNNLPMTNIRDSAREFFAEKKFLGFFSLDYNDGDADLRVQWRDTIVGPALLKGLEGFWSRFRILAHMPTWPPTKDNPLMAQLVSRFGATFSQESMRLRASLASAQLYWGGDRFVIRDLNVISPVKRTNITLKGSMGVDPTHSFGTQLKININDLGIFTSLLGLDPKQTPVGGGLSFDAYITRGGEHLLWWTKPLPHIQVNRTLPGLIIMPYDFSILAKDISATVKATLKSIMNLSTYKPNAVEIATSQLPPASGNEDAMQFRVKLASPKISLPSGDIDDVFLSINAKSSDALKAPTGTAFKDEQAAKQYISTQKSAYDVDFTAKGMPRGLVGTTFSRLGNVHGHGKGGMTSNWFMGGLHDESRIFHLEFEDFNLHLPGINSKADLRFLYALPIVKRNWPWIDGNFSINVDNWRWIGLVTGSNVRGSKIDLASELKSFYDASGVPRQYFNASVKADRFDSTQFIVRNIYGTAESKNVHELADILALSTGKLREALVKKLVYKASPNTALLESSLQLGAGRASGFNWHKGDFDLRVVDENAKFKVQMNGDVSAILDGTYSFRKRVVSLKQMQFLDN